MRDLDQGWEQGRRFANGLNVKVRISPRVTPRLCATCCMKGTVISRVALRRTRFGERCRSVEKIKSSLLDLWGLRCLCTVAKQAVEQRSFWEAELETGFRGQWHIEAMKAKGVDESPVE